MPLRRLPPLLLNIARFFGGELDSDHRRQILNVQRSDAQILQDDIHSCNIFALMYIEALISGCKITKNPSVPDKN